MSTADRSGSKRPWFRRRRILAVALLAAAPWLCLLAGNLWLASPWGKSWLARKISAKTGLTAHLESATATPWTGICLKGLVLDQPESHRSRIQEPLLKVESIRAWPRWESWLRRQWELQSLEIDSPRAVLPVRWLSHLVPIQQSEPPTLAAAASPQAPAIAIRPASSQPPVGPLPVIPESSELPPIPPLTVSLPPPPPGAAIAGESPTVWVTVRNGSFALMAEGIPEPLMELDGLDTAVPVAGGPADSSMRVSRLRSAGAGLATQVCVPLRWQSPILFLGPADSQFAGLDWKFGGKVGLVPGLPVEFESEIPLQTDRKWTFPTQGECSVREYRSTARFGGFLSHPFSWKGATQVEASGISLSLPGQPACHFDRGGATLLMANGIVSCPELRLIGDNLSLLGNATVIPDGRAAGVLRIVAEPSFAMSLTTHFQRSGKRIAFGQLGTPDRLASDILIAGNGEGTLIQLGQGGDTLNAQDAVQMIRNSSRR
ncbi:hypothetical protein KBB96_06490 [Luteolibacter ambystomatis]|uniref:Uncharacterized protein n=1 Tax=Luteolibacter ambystomatis TaxID=2824561 RepID=A0A975J1Y3_9BACT|nr:hypothetical protein [Luteolibacter ambystomatis]QUE52537.1 hypothetical protein KBB96_06490 [Luteolibacter ambystomatis]